jgi:hypothetical protein
MADRAGAHEPSAARLVTRFGGDAASLPAIALEDRVVVVPGLSPIDEDSEACSK